VGLVSALGFLAVAVAVTRNRGIAFDEAIVAAVQGLPVPVGVWEAITGLGGILLIPIAIVFVLAALATRRVRLALIVAFVLLAATLLTDVVKDYVARPRPGIDPLVAASGYSFPSGHSLTSAATYGLIALVVWRSELPLLVRRLAVVLGLALPFLIGLSRIALGVHYPSDVLGGWLAGIALVAVAATLIRVTGAMQRDVPGGGESLPLADPGST